MALNWFLNSAFTQVLGRLDSFNMQKSDVVACPSHDHHQGFVQECVKKSLTEAKEGCSQNGFFQMPLHYPRYTKADYEKMEEWKLDLLLNEYGLVSKGTLDEKRAFAMGAFLWPDQL